MITCKEDLFGKYIAVTSKMDADHVKSICESFGINAADWPGTKYESNTSFALIGHRTKTGADGVLLFSDNNDSDEDTIFEFCNLGELEAAELPPSIETLQSALDKSQLKVMELTEQLAEVRGVKPPRTKVEYVKCEFEHAWQAVKAFEEGVKMHFDAAYDMSSEPDKMVEVESEMEAARYAKCNALYERTEVEIDWRKALSEFIDDNDYIEDYTSVGEAAGEPQCDANERFDNEFVKMCHLVAELTDKPQ